MTRKQKIEKIRMWWWRHGRQPRPGGDNGSRITPQKQTSNKTKSR
ncbi:MAG: hypothetical protein ACK518_01290 [bacterium]